MKDMSLDFSIEVGSNLSSDVAAWINEDEWPFRVTMNISVPATAAKPLRLRTLWPGQWLLLESMFIQCS